MAGNCERERLPYTRTSWHSEHCACLIGIIPCSQYGNSSATFQFLPSPVPRRASSSRAIECSHCGVSQKGTHVALGPTTTATPDDTILLPPEATIGFFTIKQICTFHRGDTKGKNVEECLRSDCTVLRHSPVTCIATSLISNDCDPEPNTVNVSSRKSQDVLHMHSSKWLIEYMAHRHP